MARARIDILPSARKLKVVAADEDGGIWMKDSEDDLAGIAISILILIVLSIQI